jgi:hypothetical protein
MTLTGGLPLEKMSRERVDWTGIFSAAAAEDRVRILIGSPLSYCVFGALGLWANAWAAGGSRTVESIVPSLAYGNSCWSSVDLQNLSERRVIAQLEPHRESGALVALVGHTQTAFPLEPGARASFRLDIAEETAGAWVRVRELVASQQLSPALAISGSTECISGDQIHTTSRQVAYPLVNPWFSGEVSEISSEVVAVINTSERHATVALCYSLGGLFSNPNESPAPAELQPVCSSEAEIQIPPFGTRQIPVTRNGSTRFFLKTSGDALVLQMLQPLDTSVKMYTVDSTIHFQSEK